MRRPTDDGGMHAQSLRAYAVTVKRIATTSPSDEVELKPSELIRGKGWWKRGKNYRAQPNERGMQPETLKRLRGHCQAVLLDVRIHVGSAESLDIAKDKIGVTEV